MRYCIDCGKPLKQIIIGLHDLPTYECINLQCGENKKVITHAEMKLQEPYHIVKIRGLHARVKTLEDKNITLKARLTALEKEVGLQ